MKRHLLLVFFLGLTVFTFGQKIEPEVLETGQTASPPKVMLKFSPLSLVSLMPAIQFSVEYRLKPKTYIQHEVGYMTGAFWESLDFYDRLHGYRVRNELRFYSDPVGTLSNNLFGGPAIYMQQRSGSGNEWFCIEECTYQQRFNYKEHRWNTGIYGVIGWQNYRSDKFFVEYGLGFGVETYYKKNIGPPEGANQRFGSAGLFDFDANRWYFLPTGVLSLKIGFKVK